MSITSKEMQFITGFIKDSQNKDEVKINLTALHQSVFDSLNEIVTKLMQQNSNLKLEVFSNDSFKINTNFADYEPLNFYIVFNSTREVLNYDLATIEKNNKKKKKKKPKQSILSKILGTNDSVLENSPKTTATDLGYLIMNELRDYISTEDRVFALNGTVKLKLKEDKIIANIIMAYKFDNDNLYHISYPYVFTINLNSYIENMLKKDIETKGRFSLFCKIVKFFEIELVYMDKTDSVYCFKNGFVENLFFNIPNNLFVKNNNTTLLNIINFLKLANLNKFVLADGTNAQLFDNADYTVNDAKNFVKKIIYFYDNFSNLFEITKD